MIGISHIKTVIDSFIETHRLNSKRLMSSIFYEDLVEEFAIHLSEELGVAYTSHQVFQMNDDEYIDQIMAVYAQATPVANNEEYKNANPYHFSPLP